MKNKESCDIAFFSNVHSIFHVRSNRFRSQSLCFRYKICPKQQSVSQPGNNGSPCLTPSGNYFGGRMHDPALGRWWRVDPLGEKFYGMSPYNVMANNPLRYVDPNGMEFTDAAWEWVNQLVADINGRQQGNNDKISEKRAKLEGGRLSERKVNKLNRQIERLEASNQELDGVSSEIATLAASKQVYNVVESSSLNESGPVQGMGTNIASTSFNSSTHAVDITISSNAGLGMFAHELKHGYQFEPGKLAWVVLDLQHLFY